MEIWGRVCSPDDGRLLTLEEISLLGLGLELQRINLYGPIVDAGVNICSSIRDRFFTHPRIKSIGTETARKIVTTEAKTTMAGGFLTGLVAAHMEEFLPMNNTVINTYIAQSLGQPFLDSPLMLNLYLTLKIDPYSGIELPKIDTRMNTAFLVQRVRSESLRLATNMLRVLQNVKASSADLKTAFEDGWRRGVPQGRKILKLFRRQTPEDEIAGKFNFAALVAWMLAEVSATRHAEAQKAIVFWFNVVIKRLIAKNGSL